tara:strand:- start:1679 stop:1903 length:225 start_codon:yes stop_codon:yes gene_type:complete
MKIKIPTSIPYQNHTPSPMITPSPDGAQYHSQGCQPLVKKIIHILILAVLLPFFRNNADKILTFISTKNAHQIF